MWEAFSDGNTTFGWGLSRRIRVGILKLLAACLSIQVTAWAAVPEINEAVLASHLKVGDVVFIRVSALPFKVVADTTQSWTNHVGVVVSTDGPDPAVAESTFPISKQGSLTHFLARSEDGRVAVRRLPGELTPAQQAGIRQAAHSRMRVWYDTGFDLHSSGQFCSRFVYEVMLHATGVKVGKVETFAQMLERNPQANQGFWHLWFLGRIPWQRQTVTPASELESPAMENVFDGRITVERVKA